MMKLTCEFIVRNLPEILDLLLDEFWAVGGMVLFLGFFGVDY